VLDEVLLVLFYIVLIRTTGEDLLKSCHGSPIFTTNNSIVPEKMGPKLATAGAEIYTACLSSTENGLESAEAVADLIASDNEASHQIAIQQMRVGSSNEIKKFEGTTS